MQIVKDMLVSHSKRIADLDLDILGACIEGCHRCEFACNSCADACLAEPGAQGLLHCIRLNQDCSDICAATARVLARQTEPSLNLMAAQLDAAELACRLCAEECERHADKHDHCRICAEACRTCEHACRHLMQAMSVATS